MIRFDKIATPDGAYGPFHFNCMIHVQSGVIVMVDPQPQADGLYELADDGSSLSFKPTPPPQPADPEK